jgi:hypothetical protein
MHIKLGGTYDGYGSYDCCNDNKRALVDKAVDGLGGQISQVFKWPFTRDTRCIINGWTSCKGPFRDLEDRLGVVR